MREAQHRGPDVSVIIVNWNTVDLLTNCLGSVTDQDGGITLEVIVVDNASTDGSVEMVAKEFPRVQLIANKANRGFATANNQGMKAAKGRYVLLLNSDTLVLDDALSRSVAFLDAHPEAAVVGCRVLNPDRTLQRSCSMFPSALNLILSTTYLYKLFARSRFFGREQMTWWDHDDAREVQVVKGCFMLVRTEAIAQVGGMDEGFFMYAEETDWCYRFRQAGWKMLFTPDAQIVHFGGASSRRVKEEMVVQYARSMIRFFKKHKGFLHRTAARICLSAFYLARSPAWWLRGLLRPEDRQRFYLTARAFFKAGVATWGPCRPNSQAS